MCAALGGLLAGCVNEPTTPGVPAAASLPAPAARLQPPISQDATLIGLTPVCNRFTSNPESLVFLETDGTRTYNPLERFLNARPCTFPAQVRLTPGRHVVKIMYTGQGEGIGGPLPDYALIEIDAEPMAVYDVKRIVKGYSVAYGAVKRP